MLLLSETPSVVRWQGRVGLVSIALAPRGEAAPCTVQRDTLGPIARARLVGHELARPGVRRSA